MTGDVDNERVAALETALKTVGAADTPTRARLLAALGLELVYAGDWERRVRLADEALALARRSGDAAALADVLLQRFTTITFPDTLEERLANTEELVALAERLGDPVVSTRALLLRFRVFVESGAMEEADRHAETAERLSEELGQPTIRWLVGFMAAARAILAGDLDDGEVRAHAVYELGKASGQPDAATLLAGHLFFIRFDQGRLGEIEDRVADGVAALPGVLTFRALLALLLCELDRPEEATPHYELLAAADFTGIPKDNTWMITVPPCAAVCAALGDQARSRVLFRLLAPYASQISFTGGGSFGAVAHHLAMLAATFRDFDEAGRRFADAAAVHERIGAPNWLARTRLESARMLLTRRQPGDAERARELLGQALTTARERGLANIERRAVHLLM